MNTIQKIFRVVVLLPLFLISCSNDDSSGGNISKGEFSDGFFVLNEGISSPATASITFIGDDGRVEQDIFRTINPQADPIGTYLQNMFFDTDKAYIVSGSANSVTVVNRYTFEYIATIASDFLNPRYGIVADGKAFVTNSGNFGSASGYVTVVNLTDYTTSKIMLHTTAEQIAFNNNKVYVSNGYYGNGQSVTVIDPVTATVEETIDLGTGNTPIGIAFDNQLLYVLTKTKVFVIDTDNYTVSRTLSLPLGLSNPSHLVIDGNKAYFTANGTSIYGFGLEAENIDDEELFTHQSSSSSWGALYGFTVKNQKLYITDINGNGDSDGKLYIYDPTGALIVSYDVGLIPNGVYFN